MIIGKIKTPSVDFKNFFNFKLLNFNFSTMSDIVDQNNNTVKRCQIQFTLNETYASPVFIYYRLQNYYSNDREYVKSRSWVQLRGGTASVYFIFLT